MVEHQPSKLRAAGSSPVSRSIVPFRNFFRKQYFEGNPTGETMEREATKSDSHADHLCPCSSVAEHFLGKEEVPSSILGMG